MDDDFDVNAAVDEIGGSLGFESEPEAGDAEINLEVTLPAEAPAASEPPTPPAEPSSEASTTTPAADAPPRTWRKEASATWAALPSEAKAEILKREDDIFKGIEAYKGDATYGKSVRSAVQPYEAIMAANGMDPVTTIGGMLRGHHTLATGTPEQKATLFKQMARDYHIDLASLAAPAGEPPYIDPAVAALQNQLQAVQSQLSQQTQRQQAEARSSVKSQVDAFADDPKNVYFNEVAADVVTMLQKGAAGSLQEAYEKAIWLNPTVRAKEIARTTAETSSKVLGDAREREAAVKKATAANVKARAKSGSATTPLASLDDTLEATLARIKSR
jgi:hypothetical protein